MTVRLTEVIVDRRLTTFYALLALAVNVALLFMDWAERLSWLDWLSFVMIIAAIIVLGLKNRDSIWPAIMTLISCLVIFFWQIYVVCLLRPENSRLQHDLPIGSLKGLAIMAYFILFGIVVTAEFARVVKLSKRH